MTIGLCQYCNQPLVYGNCPKCDTEGFGLYEGQRCLDLARTLFECEQKQGSSDVVTPEHKAVLDAMEAYRNAKMKADR